VALRHAERPAERARFPGSATAWLRRLACGDTLDDSEFRPQQLLDLELFRMEVFERLAQ
jgi:hypothetical protein